MCSPNTCKGVFNPNVTFQFSQIVVRVYTLCLSLIIIMKALKCKPSAQFAYNYIINVSSKCGNIISHRSSVFEGRHNAIDLRHIDRRSLKVDTSKVDTSISDLRRSTHRSSKIEGRNIAPTIQHRADIPTIRHRILSTTALHNYYT